jgi:hypothetical protein
MSSEKGIGASSSSSSPPPPPSKLCYSAVVKQKKDHGSNASSIKTNVDPNVKKQASTGIKESSSLPNGEKVQNAKLSSSFPAENGKNSTVTETKAPSDAAKQGPVKNDPAPKQRTILFDMVLSNQVDRGSLNTTETEKSKISQKKPVTKAQNQVSKYLLSKQKLHPNAVRALETTLTPKPFSRKKKAKKISTFKKKILLVSSRWTSTDNCLLNVFSLS